MTRIRVQERGQGGGKRNSHDLYIVMLLDGHLCLHLLFFSTATSENTFHLIKIAFVFQ